MTKEKNEIIKEAEKELEYLTGDEEVKRMAFLHEKWERDYNSGMKNAREERPKRREAKNSKKIAKIQSSNRNYTRNNRVDKRGVRKVYTINVEV